MELMCPNCFASVVIKLSFGNSVWHAMDKLHRCTNCNTLHRLDGDYVNGEDWGFWLIAQDEPEDFTNEEE